MLQEFLNLLEERQTARNLSKNNVQAMYAEIPAVHKPLFRRLVSDGMNPNVEDKLLYMKDNLIKISKHRAMKMVSVLTFGRQWPFLLSHNPLPSFIMFRVPEAQSDHY